MVIHGRKGTQAKGPGGQGSLPAPGGPHTCSQSLRFPDLYNRGCVEEGTLLIWKGVGGVDFSRWVAGCDLVPGGGEETAVAQAPRGWTPPLRSPAPSFPVAGARGARAASAAAGATRLRVAMATVA